MDPGASDTEVLGQYVQRLVAYLYADYGLRASTWVSRLQRAFTTMTEFFYRVVLRKNLAKMVIMACQTCRALGGRSVETYGISMTGERKTYCERLLHWVCCSK